MKDTGTPRWVPLHNNIIKLGFIEARVARRPLNAFLFPEATPSAVDKKRGDNFGKFFYHFRFDIIEKLKRAATAEHSVDDQSAEPDYDKMVYHAARHTVATYMYRAGAPISHCEEFIGHESGERRSEFSRYNKGQTLAALKELVDKIELPIDIPTLLNAMKKSEERDRKAVWPDLDAE